MGIAGPVLTPVQGQRDAANDWWMSSRWDSPAPVTATACQDSLMSGKVVGLIWHDAPVNWAKVGALEIAGALVEYALIGSAGVVLPWLETRRTLAKRFHAALRRVLRNERHAVHVREYRGRA